MNGSENTQAPSSGTDSRPEPCCDSIVLDACCPPESKPACCGQSAPASSCGCQTGPSKS